MTLLSNAFHTFGATGNREDLTNIISMISPKDTPLYDALGSAAAKGTYHEWQTDKLADANVDNATLEGDTFTAAARTPTTRYGNYTQIFTKQFTVTETQEAVAKAGRSSELAYQKAKAMAELKLDFEGKLFTYGTAASAGAGSTTVGRRFSNVHFWTVKVTAHTGNSGIDSTSLATMTGLAITEGQFNADVQKIWEDGGRPNALYVGGGLKRTISGWGTSTSRVWTGEKKITNVVDVYEGDFNTFEIKKDMHVASSIGYMLEEPKWKKAVLIPVGEVPIAKTGLGTNCLLRTEWTLECLNPTANGLFLSSS